MGRLSKLEAPVHCSEMKQRICCWEQKCSYFQLTTRTPYMVSYHVKGLSRKIEHKTIKLKTLEFTVRNLET